MVPGVTYTVYQHTSGYPGMDCRFVPDGNEAAGLGVGDDSEWARFFRRRAITVVYEGQPYDFAFEMSNANRRGMQVSCRGGPVLVESRTDLAWPRLIAFVVVLAAAAAGVVAVA
jgi:hypothetical protein